MSSKISVFEKTAAEWQSAQQVIYCDLFCSTSAAIILSRAGSLVDQSSALWSRSSSSFVARVVLIVYRACSRARDWDSQLKRRIFMSIIKQCYCSNGSLHYGKKLSNKTQLKISKSQRNSLEISKEIWKKKITNNYRIFYTKILFLGFHF